MKKKIIALYLPQYHEIEENNMWWGKGHTEWTSCKKSVSFHKNHYQPRVPLDNNYYDLSDVNVQVYQSQLASQYGVYGFCYYHYWFEGKLLLETPINNMLNNKSIKTKFVISWANHSWINKLQKFNRKLLIKQEYGDKEDWKKHFEYLLKFFLDDRYIQVKGKPMLIIYDAAAIPCWEEMKSLWDELAVKAGLKGIFYVSTIKNEKDAQYAVTQNFDAQFEYQPILALAKKSGLNYVKWYDLKRVIYRDIFKKVAHFNYDKVWSYVFKRTPNTSVTTYLGAFTDWDVTARWSNRGFYFNGASPEKFENYLKMQVERSESIPNSDFIFITAWNEWSEGAYLEPDEKFKFAYLEAVRRVVLE